MSAIDRIRIPPRFARAVVEREGEAGRAWIERLPAVTHRLAERWNLTLDGEILHGYTAIVVPVRQANLPRMLKIRWLDASTRDEGRALRIWDGRGAVRLIDEEPEDGALLLERLDPRRSLLDPPMDEALEVATGLLRRLAVAAPAGVRTIAEEVAEMIDALPRIWERAGRPFPLSRLDRLIRLAAELARSDHGLLVNYDLHYENVLAGSREPWLAIDPKVVAGPLEYAVAQLLWNRTGELTGPADLEARLAVIVARAGLGPELARAWSVVRLTETWLWSECVGNGHHVQACRRLLGWLR